MPDNTRVYKLDDHLMLEVGQINGIRSAIVNLEVYDTDVDWEAVNAALEEFDKAVSTLFAAFFKQH